jgi:putative ABC transport system permease protein
MKRIFENWKGKILSALIINVLKISILYNKLFTMLRNYFKTMFRNLLKRKVFTVINLLGLSTGMAVCLLLTLYIQNELGYDKFQEKGDQIYRLALERKYTSRTAMRGIVPPSIGAAIKHEFPEVLESVRMGSYGDVSVTVGGKSFEKNKLFGVDTNFFSVFTGDFLAGDAKSALQAPDMVVVNESTAKKLYGSAENAMGKPLVLGESRKCTVGGVCKDWPEKSHFQFDMLVSMAGQHDKPDYYDFYYYDYLLLNKNASAAALEAKLASIVEKYVAPTIQKGFGESYQQFIAEGNGYRYFLQPLKSIHLHSELEDELRPNGSITAVYLFGAIAAFILFLACINFINLSTAVSVERAREVGIRKTFGSGKNSIVWQFLSESIIFSLLSVLLASGMAVLFVPVINNISGQQLSFTYFLSPAQIAMMLGFAVLIGMVAGLYPAFVLSSFKPIMVLKGRLKSGKHGMALRNGLVVFQFAISVILIICTIVVNNQMQYMLGDKLGFDKDHVVAVRSAYYLRGQQDKSSAFLHELSRVNGIEDVSKCSNLPGDNGLATCAFQVMGSEVQRTQKTIYVDERYVKLLGLTLKEGRGFSKDFGADSLSIILTESAVKDFGLKKPIGSKITSTEPNFNPPNGSGKYAYTVVGVVKDFHYESLHQKIAPLVIANTGRFGWGNLAVRIKGDHFKTSVAAIENLWNQFVPKHNFQFDFLDQSLAGQYKAELTAQKIFTIFSVLAIFIACIGLLGLATYATLQRTREIGIRKVLGATTGSIVLILSKDFLRLVIVSALVAFPVSWWAMNSWLQGFAYRVNVSWWIFLLAGTIAAVIAMLTISFQAIKAAVTNPVKSLRAE